MGEVAEQEKKVTATYKLWRATQSKVVQEA
jgi:hypothetical protein